MVKLECVSHLYSQPWLECSEMDEVLGCQGPVQWDTSQDCGSLTHVPIQLLPRSLQRCEEPTSNLGPAELGSKMLP